MPSKDSALAWIKQKHKEIRERTMTQSNGA